MWKSQNKGSAVKTGFCGILKLCTSLCEKDSGECSPTTMTSHRTFVCNYCQQTVTGINLQAKISCMKFCSNIMHMLLMLRGIITEHESSGYECTLFERMHFEIQCHWDFSQPTSAALG